MLQNRYCLALLPLFAACAGDISPVQNDAPIDEPGLPAPEQRGGPQVQVSEPDPDYAHVVVDASAEGWVYFDLATQMQVSPASPEADGSWDIAFQGEQIKLNGGVSGSPPGQQVQIFGDKVEPGSPYPWQSMVAAPPKTAVDYQTDTAEPDPVSALLGAEGGLAMLRFPAADTEPSPLTGAGDYGWYTESGMAAASAISPRQNVAYVLQSVECRYFRLRMTAYADAQGNAGHPSFDLSEIPGGDCASAGEDAPAAPLGRASFGLHADGSSSLVEVDAADEEAWVYLDLIQGVQVSPDASDSNWDIGLRRTDIRLNGGSSGSGPVGAHDMLRGEYAALTVVPAEADFHQDGEELVMVSQPPAERTGDTACGGINSDFGWYYYSGFCNDGNGQHYISPREAVYVLQLRQGQAIKLEMLSYYSADGASAHPAFRYAVLQP